LSGSRSSLSIIVPAFNEAARIGQTVETLRQQLSWFQGDLEIRVVDDGSGDQTPLIVDTIAKQDRRVIVQREPHRGKGAAVRAGMLASSADLRFMCDADLSMPVSEISRFLAVVPDSADIAIGSREGAGAKRVDEPGYRHLLGRGFNSAVKRVLLNRVNDTQCGFKLFTAHAVSLVFPKSTIDGWAFDVEVLYIATLRNLRIQEIPIEWHYRDQSRVSPFRDPFRMMRDVWNIRRNAARGVYAEE
jgi:dolichyl-phosphate beta-glucosyltransferase